MKLVLNRLLKTNTFTIGELLINDKYQCDILEDKVRLNEKVYGKTAIPAGTYEIKMTYSPKFKCVMPLLLNVPGFEGIRIHSGNSSKDTLGCLITGKWNNGNDWISNSKEEYNKLFKLLIDCKDKITITINNV